MDAFDGEIKVLYNGNFGSYGLSKQAIELYNKKSHQQETRGLSIRRCDPFLIEVFNELGSEKCSGKRCRLKKISIPKKYENYYIIEEYYGKESVDVDLQRYILDKIRSIVSEEKTDKNKINEIKNILVEERPVINSDDDDDVAIAAFSQMKNAAAATEDN